VVDQGREESGRDLQVLRRHVVDRVDVRMMRVRAVIQAVLQHVEGLAIGAQLMLLDGDHFDIRAFHDTVLGGGAMPLAVLERRVENRIAAKNNPGS